MGDEVVERGVREVVGGIAVVIDRQTVHAAGLGDIEADDGGHRVNDVGQFIDAAFKPIPWPMKTRRYFLPGTK